MDNNLNDQITENSEGEEKSPSSYTDPNAGYTEAEPQAKNDNSVPKEAADDNLKQEEKSHPAYTYGEMPKSENGSGYGQSAPDGSACHSGTSDGTYENNTYNGNSYYNGTNQSGAYTNGYSDNQYQNSGYNTGFNASGYNNNYNSQNNCQMPPKQMDLSPLSTGEWLLTMIVGIIPCAGLILYIIWAFGNFLCACDFLCYHRSDRQSKLLWLLNKYLAGFSAGQQCFAEKLFHFFRNSLEIYSGSL